MLFDMSQPRVDHFLNATQFGAPYVLRVIESPIDRIESCLDLGPQIAETGVVNEYSQKYGDRRNTSRNRDLNCLIGHRYRKDTPSLARQKRVTS
jgi:hypothetical protein